MLHVCHVPAEAWQGSGLQSDRILTAHYSTGAHVVLYSQYIPLLINVLWPRSKPLIMHHNASEERLKNSQTSCFTVWHVVSWKFLLDSTDFFFFFFFLTSSFRPESVVLNPSLENPTSPLDPVFNHFLLCFLFFFVLPVTAPQFHRPQREQRKTRQFNPLI